MNIGIIGSGEMGRCLASKFANSGHTVAIANSRGPVSLQQTARETGATAATVEEVIQDKQVIVVSIPQKNIPALPKHLFAQLPKNVVVIDTGNYYPSLRDGNIPALEQNGVDSLWVQEQLGVPIIKVFNSILATSLQDRGRPNGDLQRIALAVSGDDATGKEVVSGLVEALGFDPFDVGTIAQSWKQQPGSPIYCRDLPLSELKRRFAIMETMPDMHHAILTQRKADEQLMGTDYPAYLKKLQD